MMLDPQEVVSHPKIALAPVQDGARFAAYFDNVFQLECAVDGAVGGCGRKAT
jgi:hypothetical protein